MRQARCIVPSSAVAGCQSDRGVVVRRRIPSQGRPVDHHKDGRFTHLFDLAPVLDRTGAVCTEFVVVPATESNTARPWSPRGRQTWPGDPGRTANDWNLENGWGTFENALNVRRSNKIIQSVRERSGNAPLGEGRGAYERPPETVPEPSPTTDAQLSNTRLAYLLQRLKLRPQSIQSAVRPPQFSHMYLQNKSTGRYVAVDASGRVFTDAHTCAVAPSSPFAACGSTR